MEAFLTAGGLVLLAELGDKSMLLAVAFATRYRPLPVFGGIAIAALIALGASSLVGTALGAALPERALAIGGGLLFIVFGLLMLRPEHDDDAEESLPRSSSVLIGVTLAFLVAEFGDKTMLATITLASTQSALPTWIGASLGMTMASGLAIVVANAVGDRLPPRITRIAGVLAFLIFGVLLLVDGLTVGSHV